MSVLILFMQAAPSSNAGRPGFWSRAWSTLIAGRQAEAERHMAVHLARRRVPAPPAAAHPDWKRAADAPPF